MKKYKVLFCDLDGTLIETISGETFPKGIWDMKLKFDVLDAIKKLNPKYVFIVSNQGGIEKGFVNENSFRRKINYIISSLEEYLGENSFIACRFCTSNDKNHRLRKPNTAMLEDLGKSFLPITYAKSSMLMIGDASGKEGQFSDTDKKTAENFGIDYMDVNDFVELYK